MPTFNPLQINRVFTGRPNGPPNDPTNFQDPSAVAARPEPLERSRVGGAQMINLLLSSSPAAFGLGGREGASEKGFLHPPARAGQSIPRCSINKRINEEKSLVVSLTTAEAPE